MGCQSSHVSTSGKVNYDPSDEIPIQNGGRSTPSINALGTYHLTINEDDLGEYDPNAIMEDRPKTLLPNGVAYAGQWKGERKHGKGIQEYPDGAVFEGEWEEGLVKGHGIFRHADSTTYDGLWDNGKANGFGILTQPKAVVILYEGEWKDDLRHGRGKEERHDGSQYEGEYLLGKINGRGRITWSGGNTYEGEIIDGDVNGWGVYKWLDRMYCGQWRSNMMTGWGEFRWSDGRVYEGQYRKGKKHGWGSFKWPDGRRYIGMWSMNKQNGYGRFHTAQGDVRHAVYSDGCRVKWLEGEDIESFIKVNQVPVEPDPVKMPEWLIELKEADPSHLMKSDMTM